MMDPGQDLLLAALSESGICPNDLFDFDPQDAALPSPTPQSISISALGVGSGMEAMAPPTPAVSIRHKPQPSTTTFVLNQLNQLPSLGTIVVTKPSTGGTARHTITVTKVVHTAPSALRGSSSTLTYSTALPSPVSTVVPSNREQIQLKDLLRTGSTMKSSSLVELMRLKPPPDIAQPVATATATGTSESRYSWNPGWVPMTPKWFLFFSHSSFGVCENMNT
uniref:Strawberry notch homolog 1 n=1 Tax=Salmo salar TaxID=8030 RepID=B5X2L0_SALSA|nr:strawberry notch homolog 1 [Salmo salar]